MALNQVSVVGPRSDSGGPVEKKKDWIDRVMEGLSIAKGITGITSDVSSIQKNRLETKALEDTQNAILTPKEFASAQASGLQPVEPGTPGSMPYRMRTGPGENDFKETPLMLAAKPGLSPLEKVTTTDPNGKPITKFVRPTEGTSFDAYIKPASGPKVEPGKTYTELVKAVETPRGNQAVQQATKALVNISNAEELIAPYRDNLNAMPQQQVSLLTAELSKIASGGVGSQHGQEALEAKTFNSKLQDFLAKTDNEPKPAELGSFLQQNADYLSGLRRSNEAVANNYKLHMYNAYKNRLSPEEDAQFKQEYADLFAKPEAAAPTPPGPTKSSRTSTTAPATQAPKVGEVHDGYSFKGGDPADPSNWERK